jgi:deazaflavin-dependent oxidoreductase (nitroreductase family)
VNKPKKNAQGRYLRSTSERVSEQVRLYEASDGAQGGTLEGRPVVILTHIGAKTGGIRKTPIMRIPDGDAYVAVASAAGASTHPAWYFNLVAHPRVHLQDHAEHHDVIAREVDGAEKQRLWTVAESYWPHFPEYRERAAGREIPILLLAPPTTQDPDNS